MLTIGDYEVSGFRWAVRGARQSYDSHGKSDTQLCQGRTTNCASCCEKMGDRDCTLPLIGNYVLGKKDLELLSKLSRAGDDHGKCMRYVSVWFDVTAPLYLFKEFDTYRIGVTENSTSTMHTIMSKPFSTDMFSAETSLKLGSKHWEMTIENLNKVRDTYIEYDKHADALMKHGISKDDVWKSMIQMLPDSFMQTRTVVCNYQVLKHMYHARKNHKLTEWHTFCEWIKSLPYAKELITNGE